MNPTPTDRLDTLLREDARRALSDDGFTRRVLGALPHPPGARPWLRLVLVPASAVIGSALAWLFTPSGTSVAQGFVDLARLQSHTPSALAALALTLAMAVTAAALVADES